MRLLILTLIFVMVVEVFIYVPSIAQFWRNELDQRLAAAQIAALTLEGAPGRLVSDALEEELLMKAGIEAVIVVRDDLRQLILRRDMPPQLSNQHTLDNATIFDLIVWSYGTLSRGGEGAIQVSGRPSEIPGQSVAIVMKEERLYQAMLNESVGILWRSLLISTITAALIYVTLLMTIVKPICRVTDSMIAFRERPEDARSLIAPSKRRDEIGMVERELAHMQEELRQALNQKTRLAHLGMAVSKINHDLRNMLAVAQLSSGRLQNVDDPKVKSFSPRLINAIDRAINLCNRSLKYGKADEPPPEPRSIDLWVLVEEVGLSLRTDGAPKTRFENKVGPGFALEADPDQLFRVLLNLVRNSLEASGEDCVITIAAGYENENQAVIRVMDNGPGLPEKAKQNLFIPFSGNSGQGGTGLGLAIAKELIEAHGGTIILEKSDQTGVTFRLCLPMSARSKRPKARAV